MSKLKNNSQDLQAYSDTDLLIEMSWKDDPASRSEAAFHVFFERYEVSTWVLVHKVCKNYKPHHGTGLSNEVLNNTFMLVLDDPLACITLLESYTDSDSLRAAVELWLSQLADKALRDLMNGGREENQKRNIRVGIFYESQTDDDDGPHLLEESDAYHADPPGREKTESPDDEEGFESGMQAYDSPEVEEVIEPVSAEGELLVEAMADGSYLPDAAFDQEAEAEQSHFTEEQRDKVRQAIEQLPLRDKEIVITVMTYEARGHYTPRDVLENLREQYGTTSDNIRAILSRFRKKLRQLLQVDIQRRI